MVLVIAVVNYPLVDIFVHTALTSRSADSLHMSIDHAHESVVWGTPQSVLLCKPGRRVKGYHFHAMANTSELKHGAGTAGLHTPWKVVFPIGNLVAPDHILFVQEFTDDNTRLAHCRPAASYHVRNVILAMRASQSIYDVHQRPVCANPITIDARVQS